MSVFLSIDLGTTGCRSILFDESLRELAISYEEYPLITCGEDQVEQDANLWWELALRTAKTAISASGLDGKQIKSISISSQGITVVPVDRDLNPLCNAHSWLDTRPKKQAAAIEKDFGKEKILNITGRTIHPCLTLPRIMWFMENCPDICEKTWKYLMPLDFLTGKLTGNCITDHSMASGTLMYDIKSNCWSREILDHYGICEKMLPDICWSGTSAGCVLPSVAAQLGISENCIVAVGAQDQKSAAYGVGLEDGVVTLSLGTAAAITRFWKQVKADQTKGVSWCSYITPGTWVTEGVINTAATCLRWVRDNMFPGEKYDIINSEALQARDRGSSLVFHPFLNGPSAPEFYPGCEGNFYGLNLSTRRGDFALAVMEGIAFQIRVLLEAMEAYGNVHTVILFGGALNSSLWCQIIADVTGMNIKIPQNSESACAGAAMLAARAAGENIKVLKCEKEYKPGELQAHYAEKYKKYRDIEIKLWQK